MAPDPEDLTSTGRSEGPGVGPGGDRSTGAGEAPVPGRWPTAARAVVLLLAAVYLAAGLYQAWNDSPTIDEGIDLATGLSHWVHHDLRMTPEHPVLSQLVATAPALLADPIVPRGEAWTDAEWFGHTDDLLSANDRDGRLRRVVFLSRLVPLAEALGIALVLHRIARRLLGEGAGLAAAALWLTTPVTLGLGHIQSIDVAFTLTVLLLCLSLLRHRDAPSLLRALWVGAALGACLATRHTTIVLVPVALGVVFASGHGARPARALHAVAAGVVGWAGLWLVYRGFDPTSPTGIAGDELRRSVTEGAERSAFTRLALLVPAPLEWRSGLGYLTITSTPRRAFLFGQAYSGSKPWFFPGSLVATVPVVVLVALLVGPLGWRWARHRLDDAIATVALPGLALFAFIAIQPLNLGLRLALPSLALWIVMASALAPVVARRARGRALLVAVAAVQAVVLLSASSHALAWRPLAFRPGYQLVADSNLDWGQDLWRVREWAEGRDAWVSVVGPRGLAPDRTTKNLFAADPAEVTGWVAVGATGLTVLFRDELAWLRKYCPVDQLAGGAVLVYRFDEPPSRRPGPDRPVDPCFGDDVSRERG